MQNVISQIKYVTFGHTNHFAKAVSPLSTQLVLCCEQVLHFILHDDGVCKRY